MNRTHFSPMSPFPQKKRQIPGVRPEEGRTFGSSTAIRPFLAIIFYVLLTIFFSDSCPGASSKIFRIGTGGQTGVYYPVGKLIAQGLTGVSMNEESPDGSENVLSGFIVVAQNSAGSIENVRMVASGEIEAGLVQADVAAWAYRSQNVFAGDESFRVIRALGSLYPEKLQIVVRRDAGVHSVSDLRGKRISIDEIGSGTLSVMRIVLKAHGMSENDLRPVYLKPVFTQDKILSGKLQGFVMMAGTPMEAVTRLAPLGLSLVPIAPDMARRISEGYPYLVPGTIPAGTYHEIPETPTLQVHALLVVSSTMEDELAYQATKALFSRRTQSLLKNGHAQGKAITLATALDGISIPLHPGAQRFFREEGMLDTE